MRFKDYQTCGACGASVDLDVEICPRCGSAIPRGHLYSFAAWWERLIATWVDVFVVGMGFGILSVVLTGLGVPRDTASTITGIGFVVGLFAYFSLMEAAKGTTLGKMVFKVRVLRTDEQPIGIAASLIRNAFKMISVFAFSIVTFVCILFSKRSQRIGDMAAGTIVVKDDAIRFSHRGEGRRHIA